MTEQELRGLVREAIARHAGAPGGSSDRQDRVDMAPSSFTTSMRRHSSHSMFPLPGGAEVDGPCLIEPAVACNHCGYCKSLGH